MTTTIGQAIHDTRDDLAVDYAAGGTTLVVAAGQGAKYAAATVTAPYFVRIDDEILAVTGRSTDTLTVVGAQGTTTAANHTAGTEKVQPIITAVDWNALRGLALALEATTGLPFGASTASAATVTLPTTGTAMPVTGTTTITDITVQSVGRLVVLQFASALQVTNGNHLKLQGNYNAVAGDTLTLLSDGTNWYELARRTAGAVIFTRVANTASAATVTLPAGGLVVVPITGTTTITSITAAAAGTVAVLEFASAACQVTNGSNLKLVGNYTSVVLGTLTLQCDGTNWIEVARRPSDHTLLTSIGTNTHAQIDTHLAASAAVHGLPASVNVLGDRDGSGEYIRRGSATTGTETNASPLFFASASVTFTPSFGTAIAQAFATCDQGGSCNAWGVVGSLTTSGMTVFAESCGTGWVASKTVRYAAIGS